jgi:hypothetical protein
MGRCELPAGSRKWRAMLITNPGAIRMGSRVLLSLGSALLIAGCTASTSSPSSSGRPVRVAAPTYAEFGDGSAFPLPAARFPEDSARLVGPHYSLQIDRVAFADRLTQDQAIGFAQKVSDIGPMRAAPGHRFMMLLTARHKVTAALENDPMASLADTRQVSWFRLNSVSGRFARYSRCAAFIRTWSSPFGELFPPGSPLTWCHVTRYL